eukprot:s2754_g3.t1
MHAVKGAPGSGPAMFVSGMGPGKMRGAMFVQEPRPFHRAAEFTGEDPRMMWRPQKSLPLNPPDGATFLNLGFARGACGACRSHLILRSLVSPSFCKGNHGARACEAASPREERCEAGEHEEGWFAAGCPESWLEVPVPLLLTGEYELQDATTALRFEASQIDFS